MKRIIWTEELDNQLKEIYSVLGPKKSAENMNLRLSQIENRVHKLQIKLPKDLKNRLQSKTNEKCNVNPELFYDVKDKEIAYLLGLIWADGFLNKSKNGCNHNLGFTMVKDDIETIRITIEKIGKWNYYERKQPISTWKPSINIITNNKRIYNFLVEHDYNKKSFISANKILSKIPDELKHYFFRGLIDGDGCFYYYKSENRSVLRQFALSSTYEQDWSYFEELCEKLNIKYSVNRSKNSKSSSSVIRITNKIGIIKLGEYIYQNFDDDKIGLIRKNEKFKLIIS